MDFPTDSLKPYDNIGTIEKIIGSRVKTVYQGKDDVLAILHTEIDVRNCTPDLPKLLDIGGRGLIISAQAKENRYYLAMFLSSPWYSGRSSYRFSPYITFCLLVKCIKKRKIYCFSSFGKRWVYYL